MQAPNYLPPPSLSFPFSSHLVGRVIVAADEADEVAHERLRVGRTEVSCDEPLEVLRGLCVVQLEQTGQIHGNVGSFVRVSA